MSQSSQSFRSPSPATGPQVVRAQERKGPVGSAPTTIQPRAKSAATSVSSAMSAVAKSSHSQVSRISPVPGLPPTIGLHPSSGLQQHRRSPVTTERSGMSERGGGAFEVRAPAAAKQKRSTLAQGSATAARRPSGVGTGGYGSLSSSGTFSSSFNISATVPPFNISANGTPRTQYSDALTPRGQGAPYTPTVTVNPNIDGAHKGSLGLRHHNAVKSSGIAYEVGPEGALMGDAGMPAAGQRRLLSAPRRSMAAGGSALMGAAGAAGSGWMGFSSAEYCADASLEHQRQSISQAIGLLENSQLLQQDAVLRDIVQIIVNRLNARPSARPHADANPRERVVVTSDNGTQTYSVETGTQTEAPKYKEKRIRPLVKGKLRRAEGQNCSLSDSDVPSDQAETVDSNGMGIHRRRNSLDDITDISLSTNSPRESCDGYSRDTSEASGPASVSSMVQMSVASSTDASQTATLAHDYMTPQHANFSGDQCDDDQCDDNLDGLDNGVPIEPFEQGNFVPCPQTGNVLGPTVSPTGGERPGKGLSRRPPMSPLQALHVNVNQYIGSYQHELEGINELANSPEGNSLSPAEKQFLATASSPSPSIETLRELKRILDHHYAKLYQAGNLRGSFGMDSPAAAELQRLTMQSCLGAEDGQRVVDAETGATPERPPNPDPTKWSPGVVAAAVGQVVVADGPALPLPQTRETASGLDIPCNVRMGNSPPKHKHVKTPLSQLCRSSVPQLNLPARKSENGALESPLSTPRSGSAFLAHANSARSSTNSGSATSTPRVVNLSGLTHLTQAALAASAAHHM